MRSSKWDRKVRLELHKDWPMMGSCVGQFGLGFGAATDELESWILDWAGLSEAGDCHRGENCPLHH